MNMAKWARINGRYRTNSPPCHILIAGQMKKNANNNIPGIPIDLPKSKKMLCERYDPWSAYSDVISSLSPVTAIPNSGYFRIVLMESCQTPVLEAARLVSADALS